MQRLAGLITENEYQESLVSEEENIIKLTQEDVDNLINEGFQLTITTYSKVIIHEQDSEIYQAISKNKKPNWAYLNKLLQDKHIPTETTFGDKKFKMVWVDKTSFEQNITIPPRFPYGDRNTKITY